MPTKSWQLHRRTFLRGLGVTIALPYLEAMSWADNMKSVIPNRFCAIYFPFGIAHFEENDERAEMGWWPAGEGKNYRMRSTMKPLEPFRDQLTPLQGLDHPYGYKMGGHGTVGIFLTGQMRSHSRNGVSADQIAARHLGADTRFPSLVCSVEGGAGMVHNSDTISFDELGYPIPGVADPQEIFQMLFGVETEVAVHTVKTKASILDRVMESTRALEKRLGAEDRRKLDEYMVSVRSLERDIARSKKWLDTPKPKVDASNLTLDSDRKTDPKSYLRTIYELLVLAFQTDSTRVATFVTGNMRGDSQLSAAANWNTVVGGRDVHQMKHNGQKDPEPVMKYDRFLLEQLAYFLERLQSIREGDATLLDRTALLYGSSNSVSHTNRNYPLILAGGKRMGLQHNKYLKHAEGRVPMSNLLLTMLQAIGVRNETFADSTGTLSDLLP